MMTPLSYEQNEVALTLHQFQSTLDYIKYVKKQIEDIVYKKPMEEQLKALRELFFEHYSGDHGILAKFDELILDGDCMLKNESVTDLIDALKTRWAPELEINNAQMYPISVYHGNELVGIARNCEAILSIQKQIKDKHLTGYSLMYEGEVLNFDENGVLDEPTRASLTNNMTLELLKELAKKYPDN